MIPLRVVVDEREKASGVPDELSKFGVRVYFSKLPTADYVLSPDVAVERKSVHDLVSSIYDGRLFRQAAEIASTFDKPYILVEGDQAEARNAIHNVKAYYGAIAYASLAYGIRLVHTSDRTESAIAITELLKHVKSKPASTVSTIALQKPKTLDQQQLALVSSLPGVGQRIAERLLTRYGSPDRVMRLTTGELSMVPGIGWKRAERIRRMLETRYGQHREESKQVKLEE